MTTSPGSGDMSWSLSNWGYDVGAVPGDVMLELSGWVLIVDSCLC